MENHPDLCNMIDQTGDRESQTNVPSVERSQKLSLKGWLKGGGGLAFDATPGSQLIPPKPECLLLLTQTHTPILPPCNAALAHAVCRPRLRLSRHG